MRDRESIRLAECHSSNTCSSRGWARAKSGSCGTQSRSLMWATGTELPDYHRCCSGSTGTQS